MRTSSPHTCPPCPRHRASLLAFLVMTALTGCSTQSVSDKALAQANYWRRIDVTQVTYINGVSAQRLLNQDISTCLVDIKNDIRMNQLRKAVPANIYGMEDQYPPGTYDDELAINDWDSPERDGYLRAEHTDYHNFESCMFTKGWTRTEFVPYDTVERAHKAYTQNINQADENATKTPKKQRSYSSKKASDEYNLNE